MLLCGITAQIMITTKKSISKGVKSMSAKAMSWSQVCKSLSGIGGFVEIADGKKVRPLELMQSLGVHVLKNNYTPKDIFTAWSARMMKNGQVHIMHSVPVMVSINGKDYKLCTQKDDEYRVVSQQVLCPLVSMADKKQSSDVVVNTTNVLRGLQQSVFITSTMEKIEKSAAKVAAINVGYVNIATKKNEENWVKVAKANDGTWGISISEKKVASNAKKAAADTKKSSTKKSSRKAA